MTTRDVLPTRSERHPLAEMLAIAAPTVVTMTSYTVMQFIDALMVSRIGPERVYVAAQGNGGMIVWTAMSVALGMINIINTYVAQNLGAGKPERGAAYAWNGLWIAAAWAVALLPVAILAPTIFAALGHEARLHELESAYTRILAAGAFFTLGARTLHQYFFGMHRPMVVMVSALVGNVVNVVANAVLIFGTVGPPESTPLAGTFRGIATVLSIEPMGVSGAALGTVLGTAVELAIPAALFLSPRLSRTHRTREGWRPSRSHLSDIVRVGWPGALMMGNEMICWGFLMTYLIPASGRAAGEDAVLHNAAGWIVLRYMHASFMPSVGMSIAVTAMVGRAMGMKRPDLAARRAWLGLAVTVAYMGLCGLAFLLFGRELVGAFAPAEMPAEDVERLVRVGSAILVAAAVFQVFDAVAIIMSGALRGAGDTVWPGVVTVICSWVFVVGMGLLMIEVAPSLGALGPWIAASAYIIVLGVLLLARFLGGRWRSIELVRDEPGAVSPAEVVAGTTPGTA